MSNIDTPETPEVELEKASPEQEQDNGYEKPKPPTGYVGYVTASAFAAIAALFGFLLNSKNNEANRLEKELQDRKVEHVKKVTSDSIKIVTLEKDVKNCSNDALDDLEVKLKKAKQLRDLFAGDYDKVNKEVAISQQTTAEVKAATANLKQAIKTSGK